MRVLFLLPGFARFPVGGYAVVYQYANYMVQHRGWRVDICYDTALLDSPAKSAAVFATQLRTIQLLASLRLASGERRWWFDLDRRVGLHASLATVSRWGMQPGDVVVATAVETAHSAAQLRHQWGLGGVYFLQGVEDWNVGSSYLDETYQLPLTKVAVSPWVAERCALLGEPCQVVLNAVDADRFPARGDGVDGVAVGAVLSPSIPAKRTGLTTHILNSLARKGISSAAVGTGPRPKELSFDVHYLRDPRPAQLVDFYQSLRVFFCVSKGEGFGLTPAEATLCGAGVVSTRNGGVEAYGHPFISFVDDDPETITREIVRMHSHPSEARRRAGVGRGQLSAYTPTMAAAAFADVLAGPL